MAESKTYEELRSLTPKQLEFRLQHLQDAKKKYGITAEQTTTLNDAITAAKSVLEAKKLRGIMLEANSDNNVVLSKMFYQMSKDELMDAYDYYLSKQRETFEVHADLVLGIKDGVDGFADEYPDGIGWQDYDHGVLDQYLPGLTKVFKSIEVVDFPGHSQKSLKDSVEEHKACFDY